MITKFEIDEKLYADALASLKTGYTRFADRMKRKADFLRGNISNAYELCDKLDDIADLIDKAAGLYLEQCRIITALVNQIDNGKNAE
ncbi:MAG: hypothetical protein LBQ37_02580 [Elusimicrobiota bacterium]|jgi:hypothetical protein|nr:hypothetical protein [Elusimicrobiota bacterium]